MNQFSFHERTAALRSMTENGVDILIVGGGITGAGVALDAAVRGYRTGLVEKSDFASGTSSKSTKLVHGGIRYLPQFDVALVREGLVERGLLIQNAPFLVRPIGFVLPLYATAKRPLGTPIVPPFGIGMSYLLMAGLMLYGVIAGKLNIRRFRRLGADAGRDLAPCLRDEGLKDAFIYYDAQTDDSLLTASVIRTAAKRGAQIANYTEVIGFEKDGERISAARVRDRLSGEMLTIRVGTVINAGGVFAERIEAMATPDTMIQITPAKGVHLTVPHSALGLKEDAIVLPETDDGRLLFIVPWGPHVTIGTTDTEGGDIENPAATPEDIEYLLRHVNRYIEGTLTKGDIISAWAGYRPLVRARTGGGNSSKLSRNHVVIESPSGMVSIVGGKLTTYRLMAEDVFNHIAKKQGKSSAHVTRELPLDGAEDWKAALIALQALAPHYGLQPDSVERLKNYGAESRTILALLEQDSSLARRIVPDLPYIMAEVVYACRHQMAMQLQDVLERRLHINFEDTSRGTGVAADVARCMAQELEWDNAEIDRQAAQYREYVARQETYR
jgi:glycerol-3-phosphate dehydrogenase